MTQNYFPITAIVIGLALGWIFWGRTYKYEGYTAEEWFNEYDETYENYVGLRSCLEAVETGEDLLYCYNNY